MTLKVITEEYLKLQQTLHEDPSYGTASLSFSPLVANLINSLNIKTLSDYGAGKKNLIKGLVESGVHLDEYYPYDPSFPEYGPPKKADLVCCIDVLEHIEPDLIDNVIRDLSKIVVNYGFFTIHMEDAKKILADGRNAHLIQKPSSWWLKKLTEYFDILHLETINDNRGKKGFWVAIKPIESIIK
jgi:hypothetical protein